VFSRPQSSLLLQRSARCQHPRLAAPYQWQRHAPEWRASCPLGADQLLAQPFCPLQSHQGQQVPARCRYAAAGVAMAPEGWAKWERRLRCASAFVRSASILSKACESLLAVLAMAAACQG